MKRILVKNKDTGEFIPLYAEGETNGKRVPFTCRDFEESACIDLLTNLYPGNEFKAVSEQ